MELVHQFDKCGQNTFGLFGKIAKRQQSRVKKFRTSLLRSAWQGRHPGQHFRGRLAHEIKAARPR
jgi:hypothetical protein